MKEEIDDILTNLLNKEPLTGGEKQLLEEWKNTDTRNKKIEALVRELERQREILNKHQKQENVFAQIQHRIFQKRKRKRLIAWSSCAAAIAIVAGIFLSMEWKTSFKENVFTNDQTYISGLALTRPTAELILPDGKKRLLTTGKEVVILSDSNREMRTDEKTLIVESASMQTREPEYYTINIPYGAEYNLHLPDGTKIFLNAGSTLRYPDQFIGDKREVFLCGEAYFEVTSDSLHPFIVHAEEVAVQVLGTAFNVNAYPDANWVKTTLVKGRVEASCGDKNFVMKPGTQVAYNKETRNADYFPVNTQQFTSWKDGYYDFEDMPLGELMQIFSRWYNIKIEFADSNLKKTKFSGRLKRYDDVKPLFEMLEYTRAVNFIFGNDRIIIQRK